MSKLQLKRKRESVQNKIDFSDKFQVGLPCEKDLRECVDHTLQTLIHLRPLAKFYEFGSLTNQLLRCSTSVSANLCEGRGRSSYPSLICFISIARGSLFEVFDHLTSLLNILQVLPLHSSDMKETCVGSILELQEMWKNVRTSFERDWNDLLSQTLKSYVATEDFPEEAEEEDEPLVIHLSREV